MSRRRRAEPEGPPRWRGAGHGGRPHSPEDSVRSLAAWVVERTLATSAPSASYLASALERLDELDRPLLRELALGTLRWLRRIDHVLQAASHRPLAEVEPALWAPLRVGVFQLLFLDRIPAHAAVDEAVGHAGRLTHRGGAGFVNAILRRIARDASLDAWPVEEADPRRRMAIVHSHPDFLVERWIARLGEERTRELLVANNSPKSLQLLAFRDRGGRESLAEELIDAAVIVEPSAISPVGLTVREGNPLRTPVLDTGSFYVQDEASQAAALLPPPRPGERVLDVAAAPGGKTFALLAAEPAVKPVMADVSASRVDLVRANLRRLGRHVPLLVADGGRPPFADGAFDRVVVDLPCTGTGTLRKHPELKWRISEAEIGRLQRQAERLLRGSLPLVARGGLLVAITCSLEPEENEEVVASCRRDHPELEPYPLETLGPPLDRWVAGPGLWRIWPEEAHDGFTVQVLRRRS